jgi:hypothetical protein
MAAVKEERTPSVFTLEAVNALIPRLSGLMAEQSSRRAEIDGLVERLTMRIGKMPDGLQVDPADPSDVRELKTDIAARIEHYQSAWEELEEMGAVLKDPRTGLVDFYGHVDGKLVWLCWRYGEDSVSHYHHLDEGFAGRKPIEANLRHRHLN